MVMFEFCLGKDKMRILTKSTEMETLYYMKQLGFKANYTQSPLIKNGDK